eukprot:13710248-Ditylum_brightwellii.AAC.1
MASQRSLCHNPARIKLQQFYWCTNEYGTLLGRWLDNGMVLWVSMVHKVGGMVERARRRPRIMVLNKKHTKDVWDDAGKKERNILRIIDDHNHWMDGVDISDQRITYYHPNVHCGHNWGSSWSKCNV